MTTVKLRTNESLERALRRLKKKMAREGIMKELRAKRHYEKPSERKRRKSREAKTKRD